MQQTDLLQIQFFDHPPLYLDGCIIQCNCPHYISVLVLISDDDGEWI